MFLLCLGLLIFLLVHSVHLYAENWRRAKISQWGEKVWKGIYSIISLIGLVLLIWGYSQARLEPVWLWYPATWSRHLTLLMMLPATILITAAYIPATHIKAHIRHPMVLGVAIWALTHLLANGTLADALLFGSFLLWSGASYIISYRRDVRDQVHPPTPRGKFDLLCIIVGTVAWVILAMYLHEPVIGVSPLG